MKELILKFHNDLTGFNSEVPIVVTYDKSNHALTYRQLNRMVMIPYLRPYYLSKKNFRFGILTSTGYIELMKGLQALLQDSDIDKEGGSVAFSIGELCINTYKTYKSVSLVGPQKYINLKLVNITSEFLSKWIMKFYSNETRTLYKLIKNEWKTNSKSNK